MKRPSTESLRPGGQSAREISVSRRSLPCWLLLTGVIFIVPALLSAKQGAPDTVLEGKLVNLPGTCPVLKTQENAYPLAARTTWLFQTLQDRCLADREVRLEGVMQAGGTFKVNHLFTVHEGRLYRVRYFCETCNLEALGPDKCVCCQQPTELQEISVDEANK
jgi:hypothetical protein